MLFKSIIMLYGIHVFSVLVHEMGHYMVAKYLIRSMDEVCIGNLLLLRISSKVQVSPIVFSAHVGVDRDKLLESDGYKIVLFFVMGPMMNMLMSLIAFGCQDANIIVKFVMFMNLIYLVIGLIPIKGTDLYNMVSILKYKKKYLT